MKNFRLNVFQKPIGQRFKLIISILVVLALFYLGLSKLVKSSSNNIEEDFYQDKKALVLKFNRIFYQSEFKVYSQQNEDGVLNRLISMFNLNNKYYVEMGTQSGVECNSRYLREVLGWKGHMFDGGFENQSINLHKEKITHWNILDIFHKYKISKEISILSEDTDYADYWIMEAILSEYSPKIVVHEVNQMPPYKCVTVPKSDKLIFWDKTSFHGASVCAFYCLAKRFNYTMVYCESDGIDCFWVRNDILENHLKIKPDFVQSVLTPDILYNNPGWSHPSPKYEPKWTIITC